MSENEPFQYLAILTAAGSFLAWVYSNFWKTKKEMLREYIAFISDQIEVIIESIYLLTSYNSEKSAAETRFIGSLGEGEAVAKVELENAHARYIDQYIKMSVAWQNVRIRCIANKIDHSEFDACMRRMFSHDQNLDTFAAREALTDAIATIIGRLRRSAA